MKKKTKKKGVARGSFTLRLPGDLLRELDQEAAEVGLSRNQLIERLIVHAMIGWRAAKKSDAAGLFEGLARDLEGIVEQTLRESFDVALWRTREPAKTKRPRKTGGE